MRDGGDFTVFDESAGRRALLRVPRPLRGLLLYLRKAHHRTDSMRLWVGWQEILLVSCLKKAESPASAQAW